MSLRRLGNPRGFASEPIKNVAPGICGRCGLPEYSWVCHKAHECEQARPGQSNGRKTAELVIEPFARLLMMGRFFEIGVNEKIGINQNHLNVSPSATASTSPMLSRLGTWRAPSRIERVRNGFRRLVGALISLIPRRKASFTISLKLASRLRRNRSIAAAISSSIVNVVLMHHAICSLML